MQSIQFIAITPERLKAQILEGVKSQLADLQNSFQPKEPTEYLTRNEVAELLKIDLSTVHNWSKKGQLQRYGIEGRVYYKRSEVENAIIKLPS